MIVGQLNALPAGLSASLDGVDEPIVSRASGLLQEGVVKLSKSVEQGIDDLLDELEQRITSIDEATGGHV